MFAPISDVDNTNFAVPPMPTKRTSGPCQCLVCTKGRDTLIPAPKKNPKPAPVRICTLCQGVIAPLVSHVCNRGERDKNVMGLVLSLPD